MAALFGVVEKCKSSQSKPVPSSANESFPFQTDTTCISKMSKGPIDPGESEVWNDPFFLPAMPPSEMRGCSYIDISYKLRVLPCTIQSPK